MCMIMLSNLYIYMIYTYIHACMHIDIYKNIYIYTNDMIYEC